MNKIYRLVWNAGKSCWMAAAEIARSSGPRSATVRSAATLSLLGASLLAQAAQPSPTAIPTGSNTRSYVAPNGTTVVDIATANAAGVSNNQYTQYNVNSQGLILNNANTSQVTRQSQLAGQVYANINLSNEASLILNQVVSSNRSTLAGFTEVLGSRADVVVANPNGITCSGCGFINTNRVTLSTGLPVLGGNGSLSGFNVTQGDILINGSGINASAQQILDLVSRSVSISGQVNVPDFGVYVGPNRWDYASRSITGSTTPQGAAPSYAIDTAALGGMYANRIFLVSTEAGVGVRMLGDAAANSGDFTLTAQGSILLNNKVSATGNVNVSANGSGSSLQVNAGSISSGQNLTLAAHDDLGVTGSAIIAGQDLSLSGATLTDAADSNSQSNNNRRYAGGNFTATFSGDSNINGTQWGSAGQWQASFGSLTIGSLGAVLYSGQALQLGTSSGDLALGKAQLKSSQDMTLSATGQLSTASDSNQGVETTGGNLALSAGTSISNAGAMSADSGTVTVRAGSAVSNSGTLYAAGNLSIADAAGNATESFSNSGTIQSDASLNLKAAASTNTASGWVQAATGSTLSLASLYNQGTWLVSTGDHSATDSITLSGALTNSGTLQSAQAMSLSASSTTNSGKLLATSDLGLANTGNLTNQSASFIQSGSTLTLSGATVTNAGTLKADSLSLTASNGFSNSGTTEADNGTATVRADSSVSNSGTLYAAGNLSIADAAGNATESFSNSGTIQSDASLNLKAAASTNTASGWVQAATGSTLSLASLYNQGTWLVSTGDHSATDSITLSGALTNSGTLQSAQAMSLSAASTDNSSKLLAAGDLSLANSGNLINESASFIQSGSALTLSGSAVTNAGTLKADSLSLTASNGFSNSGTTEADNGTATVRARSSVSNSGTLYAAGNLSIA
ncbi:two-partner secretion domain-containing protein, partial [Aquitalea pelogenes]|uniref:two-partner secretion domain-containing protein n=1 Tax=Aquitalea pelogenes TaxID=1293573 RepID=UPI0035B22220